MPKIGNNFTELENWDFLCIFYQKNDQNVSLGCKSTSAKKTKQKHPIIHFSEFIKCYRWTRGGGGGGGIAICCAEWKRIKTEAQTAILNV